MKNTKQRPELTAEHKRLLTKWMGGTATRKEMQRCMELDHAHVAACKAAVREAA